MSECKTDQILKNEDPYDFMELFISELDSWFSSDIACCDACLDGFLNDWPLAYTAEKAAFQKNTIDIESFYDGSRLKNYYSRDEYKQYLPLIKCPRCNTKLQHSIYAYELPFDVVEGFDEKLEEISKIANAYPFLLLECEFAKSIYEAIKELFVDVQPSLYEGLLYRARTKTSLKSINLEEFGFPPKEHVKEGRYNHAGMSVLYLGDSPETCYFEMREDECVIAEIKLGEPITLLDLFSPCDQHPKYSSLLSTLIYSALMSSKQSENGWHKPKYVFSRFITDCAKRAGFDAIKYPSTRCNHECYNVVIINEKHTNRIKDSIIRVFDYNMECGCKTKNITTDT